MPNLTLCTYTYNDGHLAAGLIVLPESAKHGGVWQDSLDILNTLARHGIFSRMERLIPLLLEEEANKVDFSFYAPEKKICHPA